MSLSQDEGREKEAALALVFSFSVEHPGYEKPEAWSPSTRPWWEKRLGMSVYCSPTAGNPGPGGRHYPRFQGFQLPSQAGLLAHSQEGGLPPTLQKGASP